MNSAIDATASTPHTPDPDADADPVGSGSGARPPWFGHDRGLGIFLVVASALGFLAAFDLSVEKVKKLEDPGHTLSCDLNPFISCSGVMEFPQSQIFGFPNQFIGVAAFVFPLLLGVLLISRTPIPGWVMVGLNIGLVGGVALVMYLFVQSVFVIGIGCPWCMVVWLVTIPSFCLVTAYNALHGNFGAGVAANDWVRSFARQAPWFAVLWLLVIAACVFVGFSTYFLSLV
ncbi:vitamin K epoxide reductase family protein [Brevibacterium litoralis]|uniref:vitamin K epoxide reductase family protein n=1 Tax=Brevibacterium litoralis TaxID=3138935 RepID=UPI0032EC4652